MQAALPLLQRRIAVTELRTERTRARLDRENLANDRGGVGR